MICGHLARTPSPQLQARGRGLMLLLARLMLLPSLTIASTIASILATISTPASTQGSQTLPSRLSTPSTGRPITPSTIRATSRTPALQV